MSSSWAPNETSFEIYQEKIWLQSGMLVNIPYGVELTLFVICFVTLFKNMNRYNKKRQIFLLTFIVLIFGIGTVFMIANLLLTQQAFVLYRNFPGGPGAFMNAMSPDTVGLTTSVCWVVSDWLLDALLVGPILLVILWISANSRSLEGVEIRDYLQGCQSTVVMDDCGYSLLRPRCIVW